MELCLGTAQFGMDYGVNGQKKPTTLFAHEMLLHAVNNGIVSIDTAKAYGNAEEVVGLFLSKKIVLRSKLKIISKFMPNLLENTSEEDYYTIYKKEIEGTLKQLNTDYLDAYLLHSARYIFDEAKIYALARLKKDGYTKQVGVSVYEVSEAIAGLKTSLIDIIQLPYSIFDQRMEEQGFFEKAQSSQLAIDSRSTFVQGLLFMSEDKVPSFLEKARPILAELDSICSESGCSRLDLAIAFVKQKKVINRMVFGVDNLEQLKQNIESFNKTIPVELLVEAERRFSHLEADIVMPSLWHREK